MTRELYNAITSEYLLLCFVGSGCDGGSLNEESKARLILLHGIIKNYNTANLIPVQKIYI